ncbi:RICIN domain-containing protein, partial [Paenibacillus sp. Soil766]|uniref:RICIN domain-containing protein n=1 Tax=Paenibacillus sp. Soil766 TaxID=1736404 RepID=UPI001F36B2C4
MGKVDVYIDGVLAQADIDAYTPSTTKQVVLYQNSNLLNGSHTIKVVCKGTKNASSSNTICALDAFASISAPDQTAYYKLVNKNSGKVMDVNGGSLNSGANIIQWNDTSAVNQHFQIVKTASGDYKIINKNSGKVLDVSGGSTSTGA